MTKERVSVEDLIVSAMNKHDEACLTKYREQQRVLRGLRYTRFYHE